ncbi:integrin alpha-M-like, partial [Carcharodon carcharias]|uniref:integrin alpha-M-like n=1 Tax=Carcharodon carcharias TaxID=13397 RepID=UPI001B7E46DA
DAVVLGTPGAYGWNGGMQFYHKEQKSFINITTTDKDSKNGYLGYSVQEAIRSGLVFYAVGAPRYRHTGEVIIFQRSRTGSWKDVQHIPGEQIGSYFGSEICTLDVTGDDQTDFLLIGAPLYRDERFGGIVIICTMSPKGNFSCRWSLRGDAGNGLGRFGSAIAGLRDLNGDGLGDVAIGAPLEEDHRGSVYIYHGQRDGINPRYSQRIEGVKLSPGLKYFGQSLSGVMDVSGDLLTDLVVGALGTVTVFRSRPVLNVSITFAVNPQQIPFEAYECHRRTLPNRPLGNITVCFTMSRLVADNWGELKANITYSLLLDVGHQKGRAIWQSMSSRLTKSLQLSTVKQKCREYNILLQNCVKDYFDPIEFSLNFTLAGEVIPGSKGLRPILNKYSKTSQKYELPFEKDCGVDNECVDYLRVAFNFSGGDVVVIGQTMVLIVTVVLQNAHEDSSNTQLNFIHPSRLSFKKITMVQTSGVHVVCRDLQNEGWVESGRLSCGVNHPVFRKGSHVAFNAEFDISLTGSEERTANFTITASSENSLRITNESSFTRNMILYYAVNVVISGIEYTRHVSFAAGRQEARLVKHSYQVENLGKRSLPLQVRFTVPGRIGTNTLWNVTVSERKPGNRSSCQLPVKSLAKVQTEAPRGPQDYLMLDCGIAQCLELQCEVAALEDHGTVIFDIQGEFMSAALAETKQLGLVPAQDIQSSWKLPNSLHGRQGPTFVETLSEIQTLTDYVTSEQEDDRNVLTGTSSNCFVLEAEGANCNSDSFDPAAETIGIGSWG